MIRRPDDMNAFEFAVAAGLRAAQLHRGCTPRVNRSPKVAVTAQREVATRQVLPTRIVPDTEDLTPVPSVHLEAEHDIGGPVDLPAHRSRE